MAKGAVGLTAGYWPEDVYRYLAVPGLSLDDGLISRPARRRAQQPALVWQGGSITYQELAQETDATMKGFLGVVGDQGGRAAVAVQDPLEALKLVLGGLKARLGVLIADPSSPPEELTWQLLSFEAGVVVADADAVERVAPAAAGHGLTVMTAQQLRDAEEGPSRPRVRLDLKAPTVALVADDRGDGRYLSYHSHSSLLAGAISWSTFLSLKEHSLLLSLRPLYTWEGIYSVFPALFRGGASVLAGAEDGPGVAEALREFRPHHVVVPLESAARLSADRTVARAFRESKSLEGLFVSVSRPFAGAHRRHVSSALGKPLLTVLGDAETGPAVSTHPSWWLEEAVGIPVTNVDVWPMNPNTGNPLQVPWEAVEYGELGLKTPLGAVASHPAEHSEQRVREGWLRTWIVATMDPNGLFYLRSTLS